MTTNTDMPDFPQSPMLAVRRIRMCESEVAAQLALEHFAIAYAEAAIAARDAQTDEIRAADPGEELQGWAVTVERNGVRLLTIEKECVSGVENIGDFAPLVRDCAEHLLSFIGRGRDAQAESGMWKTGTPSVPEGKCREFIIAVRRAQSNPPGKVFVFSANYANNFTDDGCLTERNGYDDFTADGWFLCGLDTSGEFNEVYEAIALGEGDEIVGWQELPKWDEARAAAPQAQGVADGWHELCRRLYVELFHCDQQMRSTRDQDGEPHWTQSTVVRDVLEDAKSMLAAAPSREQVGETNPSTLALCQTCNGIGWVGGPSYYAPDEGGEPCPDCCDTPGYCSSVRRCTAKDVSPSRECGERKLSDEQLYALYRLAWRNSTAIGFVEEARALLSKGV